MREPDMIVTLSDDDLTKLANDVIELIASRMEGCDVREGMANLQCIIGCLYEQMAGNIGPQKAMMKLGEVLQQAAAKNPGHGVVVDMVRVDLHKTKQ